MTHAAVRVVFHPGDQTLRGQPIDQPAGRGCGGAESVGQLVHGDTLGLGGRDEDMQLAHGQVRGKRHGTREFEALEPDPFVELQDLAGECIACRLRHVVSPPLRRLLSLV